MESGTVSESPGELRKELAAKGFMECAQVPKAKTIRARAVFVAAHDGESKVTVITRPDAGEWTAAIGATAQTVVKSRTMADAKPRVIFSGARSTVYAWQDRVFKQVTVKTTSKPSAKDEAAEKLRLCRAHNNSPFIVSYIGRRVNSELHPQLNGADVYEKAVMSVADFMRCARLLWTTQMCLRTFVTILKAEDHVYRALNNYILDVAPQNVVIMADGSIKCIDVVNRVFKDGKSVWSYRRTHCPYTGAEITQNMWRAESHVLGVVLLELAAGVVDGVNNPLYGQLLGVARKLLTQKYASLAALLKDPAVGRLAGTTRALTLWDAPAPAAEAAAAAGGLRRAAKGAGGLRRVAKGAAAPVPCRALLNLRQG